MSSARLNIYTSFFKVRLFPDNCQCVCAQYLAGQKQKTITAAVVATTEELEKINLKQEDKETSFAAIAAVIQFASLQHYDLSYWLLI